MKRIAVFTLTAFTVFVIGNFSALEKNQLFALEPSPVLFGSSKVDITPPIGTALSGYGKRRGKPSKGIRDPLYVRTIALSNRKETFVIASLDLVLVDRHFRNRVVEKVREKIEIKDSNVMLVATHTHSGSGAIGSRFWQKFIGGRFKKKIFEEMTTLVASSILEAHKSLAPVLVEHGAIDASQYVENRMEINLEVPALLKVIRFRSQEQKILGQIINFAAHPTILPAQNRHFSGDFPGVLSHYLEAEHPESVALFLNGASADLRPTGINSDYPEKRLERYGQTLHQLTRQINFETVQMDGEWISILNEVKLPKVKVRAGPLTVPPMFGNRFFPRKTLFQSFRIGDLFFVALPAEVAASTGYEIEKRIESHGLLSFVVTHANDYVGYVIPESSYQDKKQYESQASFYGRWFEFFFHEQVDRLIDARSIAHSAAVKSGALPILYLKGNPYELGLQHGKLMSKEIKLAKEEIYRYLAKKGKVPLIAKPVAKWILTRTWKKMEPFVSYDEWMELKGLAEGSGLSMKDVKRLHAIPDFIESMCTNGVYFGSATKDGKLIHIRNLDWIREMGVHRFAAIILYEPQWGARYANLGYYGFIGSLTGVNENGISVGQVGADSIDESLHGTPMPFLLKRILMRSDSLEDAIAIITKSKRTSSFNYVFGDALNKKAVGIETTQSLSQVFWDNDPLELNSGYGFPMKGVLMRADPAFDPNIRNLQTCSKGNPKKKGIEMPGGSAYETRYKKQSELVKAGYGNLDVERAKEIARAVAPDSNIQSAVIQFPDIWIANATDEKSAAQTDYHKFNFEELFSEMKQLSEKKSL